jgi:hypothetical protein
MRSPSLLVTISYYSIPAGMLGRGPHTLSTQWSGRPTAQARLLGVASYLWAAAHRGRCTKPLRGSFFLPFATPPYCIFIHPKPTLTMRLP